MTAFLWLQRNLRVTTPCWTERSLKPGSTECSWAVLGLPVPANTSRLTKERRSAEQLPPEPSGPPAPPSRARGARPAHAASRDVSRARRDSAAAAPRLPRAAAAQGESRRAAGKDWECGDPGAGWGAWRRWVCPGRARPRCQRWLREALEPTGSLLLYGLSRESWLPPRPCAQPKDGRWSARRGRGSRTARVLGAALLGSLVKLPLCPGEVWCKDKCWQQQAASESLPELWGRIYIRGSAGTLKRLSKLGLG